jgi:ABC-type lipoprotein export system ATPase subunit
VSGPVATTGAAVVRVEGVSKSYRRGPEEVHAVRGATFALEAGSVVAMVGPSGSGKTTLLNLLCGWEAPDAGRIAVNGREGSPADLPWADLAVVPQDLGLIEELSIGENVGLPGRLSARPADATGARARALLAGFGLDLLADRSPAEVSLGEQQRAALARALVLSPRLLLADEPTGHQDAGWARVVFRALRLAAREGTSCLVATHNREALKHADRVLGIRDGVVRWLAARPAARTEPARRRRRDADGAPVVDASGR